MITSGGKQMASLSPTHSKCGDDPFKYQPAIRYLHILKVMSLDHNYSELY